LGGTPGPKKLFPRHEKAANITVVHTAMPLHMPLHRA
jgi:hypothetical protein